MSAATLVFKEWEGWGLLCFVFILQVTHAYGKNSNSTKG